MADKADITPELLRQLLRYEPETGKLFWKPRPLDMFSCAARGESWNKRYSGKEALTASKVGGYKHGYVLLCGVSAHRVAWAVYYGESPDGHIDHINHDTSDNRLENLRVVTHQENQRNRSIYKTNSSGFNGICWNKRHKKWQVYIQVSGKKLYLGRFDNIDNAVAARQAANSKYEYHSNHGGS